MSSRATSTLLLGLLAAKGALAGTQPVLTPHPGASVACSYWTDMYQSGQTCAVAADDNWITEAEFIEYVRLPTNPFARMP